MSGQFASFSLRSVKGQYFLRLEETQAASWVPKIANMFTTDQPYEIHKWLGGAPAMSQWRGERVRDALGDYDLTVVSDKFDATLSFDVDDIRRDKTGQIMQRVGEMGTKAATLPQRLFSTLLAANPTAYDGTNFFATSHSVGTVNNLLAPARAGGAGTVTSAEMSAAILQSVQGMLANMDDTGDPSNEFASNFLVMVPTTLWQVAVAALKDVFTSAGVSNTLLNTGMNIEVVVNPRLAATDHFYMFRTDANIKACIWQEEELAGEAFKTLGLDSDNAFWRDEISFGAKRIAQSALGRFELASKSVFA